MLLNFDVFLSSSPTSFAMGFGAIQRDVTCALCGVRCDVTCDVTDVWGDASWVCVGKMSNLHFSKMWVVQFLVWDL